MKKINLYWFNRKGRFGNFGDELGPFIIRKLSDKEIYQIPIPRSSIKLILAYIKGLILGSYSINIFNKVLKTFILKGRYIISIGSIIGWGSGKRIVWGSGVLFTNERIDNGLFLAVRGKYSQNRLKELGYPAPDIIGDPALLTPLVYHPTNIEKAYELGLILHHTQYEHFASFEEKHGIKVINVLNEVETVINEINSCKNIMATSLHGIIVAQAYNIPALWYEYPKIFRIGEDIKFLDYFSSVGISEYKPFPLFEIDEFDKSNEIMKFETYKELTHINVDLSNIQRSLLKVAPFPIIEKYKTDL